MTVYLVDLFDWECIDCLPHFADRCFVRPLLDREKAMYHLSMLHLQFQVPEKRSTQKFDCHLLVRQVLLGGMGHCIVIEGMMVGAKVCLVLSERMIQ